MAEEGARFFIEDQGALNGVRIANQPIAPYHAVPVSPGVAVELGGVLLLIQKHGHTGLAPPQQAPSSGRPSPIFVEHPLISRVANNDLTVLIQGETGVGKDVLARAFHERSPRAKHAFLALNCASIPENLLESELFGHEKGAFSGADRAKVGLFESADGGTVFLDEVGELPPAAQAKLLRFLESREVMPVGARRPKVVDVRMLAATHRSLTGGSGGNSFRRDLYYRLEQLPVWIPPLRERRDEIVPLAERFIAEFCVKNKRARPPCLSEASKASLWGGVWEGNIRELRNVIDRTLVLFDGELIEREHLSRDPAMETLAPALAAKSSTPPAPPPPAVSAPAASPSSVPLSAQLDDLKKQRILDALAACGGNQSRTASLLGIPRRTLINRLEEYGAARPRKPHAKGDSSD